MREGNETATTSIPPIVGSKDPDASSSKVSKKQSKETKDLNIDELTDLIVARLNPQAKNVAHRDHQGNAHLYPRFIHIRERQIHELPQSLCCSS